MMPKTLTITNHSRDSADLTYVYPVLSRRSGGLSIGINLNPNNACNWRCVYCQVPNLQRGGAPAIDLNRLEEELRGFLQDVLQGDFYERFQVEPAHREIRDIAISGNGEPTSAREFDRIVELIGRVVDELALTDAIKRILITNGSLLHRAPVQRGLMEWARLGGEIWFKLDGASDADLKRINGAGISLARLRQNLQIAAHLCPTWLQTCVFKMDDRPPSDRAVEAYLRFLAALVEQAVPLQGILLYGLARPSMQPEAARLAPVSPEWLDRLAEQIRRLGIAVKVSA